MDAPTMLTLVQLAGTLSVMASDDDDPFTALAFLGEGLAAAI